MCAHHRVGVTDSGKPRPLDDTLICSWFPNLLVFLFGNFSFPDISLSCSCIIYNGPSESSNFAMLSWNLSLTLVIANKSDIVHFQLGCYCYTPLFLILFHALIICLHTLHLSVSALHDKKKTIYNYSKANFSAISHAPILLKNFKSNQLTRTG